MNLKLHNCDEVFLVKLDSALYFKAEDHYTCVYYGCDTKQLLPFGLAHIEDALELCDADYMRFGRSHIINAKGCACQCHQGDGYAPYLRQHLPPKTHCPYRH